MTYRQHCYGSFSKHMATWPPAQAVNNNGQHTDTCTCGQVCLAVRLLSHGWPLPITHLLSKSSTCVHHGTPLLHQGLRSRPLDSSPGLVEPRAEPNSMPLRPWTLGSGGCSHARSAMAWWDLPILVQASATT